MNIIEAAKEAGFRERNGSIRVQHSNGSFVVVDEQLERFAAIIRAQALENAKQACEAISVDRWSLYKGRAPYTGKEPGRADPDTQGQSDGADACAAAIESLKGQP